jgi:hypothetical protein
MVREALIEREAGEICDGRRSMGATLCIIDNWRNPECKVCFFLFYLAAHGGSLTGVDLAAV